MNRRAFLHRLGLVTAGSIVLPYRRRFWPGHDFARHVVFSHRETAYEFIYPAEFATEFANVYEARMREILSSSLSVLRQNMVMPDLIRRPFEPIDALTGLTLRR